MTLLIDIGNTRLKWACLADEVLSSQQAEVYSQWGAKEFHEHILTSLQPQRVLIANVGGNAIATTAIEAIQSAFNKTPEFICSTVAAAGIRSGYSAPGKLGVDRWLAMIAAYQLHKRACCVVSVGTAMTVDAVDATGQHLGGFIVPGPELMTTSLLRGTSDIALRAQNGSDGEDMFANNTRGAVYQGANNALAAVIERACAEMTSRHREVPALIMTGGATDRVIGALRVPFQLIPDLVLRGLAAIASESAT